MAKRESSSHLFSAFLRFAFAAVLFVTSYIETTSPVSAWLTAYLVSLPAILVGKEVGVEVVRDVDAETEANDSGEKEFDPYSGRREPVKQDQDRESETVFEVELEGGGVDLDASTLASYRARRSSSPLPPHSLPLVAYAPHPRRPPSCGQQGSKA